MAYGLTPWKSVFSSQFQFSSVQFQPFKVRRWTLAFPIGLHWSMFWAIRWQCFTKLSKPSLHLALGLPRFLVRPRGVQNLMRLNGYLYVLPDTWPAPFEFTYRFHGILDLDIWFLGSTELFYDQATMFIIILSRALCKVLSFKVCCFVRFQVSDP